MLDSLASPRWARWRWPAAVAACFAGFAAADRSWVNELGPGLLWALGAGAGTGLLLGAVTGSIAWAVRRQRLRIAILPWGFASTLAAAYLAHDLGVLARLDGSYRDLALLAAAGCGALALLGIALAALVQPHAGRPRGWLLERSRLTRSLAAASLLLAAGATLFVDRTVEPGSYRVAHDTLRWMGLALSVVAVWTLGFHRVPRPEWWVAGLGASFLSTFTLTPRSAHELAVLLDRPYSGLALRSMHRTVDFDLDGYAGLFGGGDCAQFASAINPGEEEIPSNSVDDNCRRGDAPARREQPGATVPVPSSPAPNSVVLITVDTLAARRMSLYGARRDTTPELERWAQDAVVFERAYSSGGWTSLAISSMFRGLYPRRLRWTRLLETNRFNLLRVSEPIPRGESLKTSFGMPLEDPREPLAYWLERRGMFTVAVANDRQSEFLDPRFVGRGFRQFVDIDRAVGKQADDADITDEAIATLAKLPADRPFFLWVHYFGPHKPDETHRGVPDFGDSRSARYDHEVAFNDQQVGRLLDTLARDPRGRTAAILVTADHGEHIRGDWRGHGGDVHEATIRIPMLLKLPGLSAARVRTPVSLVDVFPTVLGLTETPGPPSDGLSLLDVVGGAGTGRVLFSETWRFDARGELINDRVAAFDGDFKLERDNLLDVAALYAQRDPQRQVDEARHPRQSSRLREGLEVYLEQNGAVDMND